MQKRKGKRNFLLSDPEGLWYDSHPLAYLIFQYEEKVREAQKEGLKAFWKQVELHELSNKKETSSHHQWITNELLGLLKDARDGSLKAIRILIRENPNIFSLPFVADRMIDLLLQYKYSEDKGQRGIIREVTWPNFLPDRSGGRKYFSEEDLINTIKNIMELEKVKKREACEILAKEVPVSFEKLYRMGHVGKRGRPKIRN